MAEMIKKLGLDILTQGLAWGAEDLEVFFLKSQDLDIQVHQQQVENIKLAEEIGIGIRAYTQQSMGFAFTTNLKPDAVFNTLKQALINAQYTTKDQYNVLPGRYAVYPQIQVYDADILKVPTEEKIAWAMEIEKIAAQGDARITKVQKAGYRDINYENLILNSQGLQAFCQGNYCGGYAMVLSEAKGEQQSGFGFQYSLKYSDLNKELIASRAVRRAVSLLGATQISSQRAVLVLEPYVAANFLGLLASVLSAETVQKGKSFLAEKMEQKIASDQVNIIDNGLLPGGLLSAPFDGEGVPMSKKSLVSSGVLRQFLHNTYTAVQAKTQSAGNGVRGSFRSTPGVGSSNIYFVPGSLAPETIIQDIDQGLYVLDIMGLHTANPISGDFSFGASGIWIEKGRLTKPVRGIAIAGNLQEFLSNIDGVGKDLTFFGGRGAPTIRINNISISGGL